MADRGDGSAETTGSTLVDVGEQLRGLAQEIGQKYFEAARVIAKTAGSGTPTEIESFLASRGMMSHEDIRVLMALPDVIAGREDALAEATMSWDGIKALVQSGEDVREEAFRLLRQNKRADAAEIDQIAARIAQASTNDWERAEQARTAYLESRITATASSRFSLLEANVDELIALVSGFLDEYVYEDGEDCYIRADAQGYDEAHSKISEFASAILSEAELLFGNDESFAGVAQEEADQLANARRALRRFAGGRFAHNGGFSFDEARMSPCSPLELPSALYYLGTSAPPEDAPKASKGGLRVLELCAGAGGMAIGLMGAGFDHVALYEVNKKRVVTLRRNRPGWNVRHEDITKVPDKEFEQYRDVDLMACGLPCGPGEDTRSEPDLFGAVLRILSNINPKALMLEYDMGKRQNPTTMEYIAAIAALRSAGYRVQEFSLNTANFGLPLARDRRFILGLRNDIPGVVGIPNVRFERKVADALENLVIPYRTPDQFARAAVGLQRQYDVWARNWRQVAMKQFLPTIFEGEEKREEWQRSWRNAGFDPSKILDRTPEVGDAELVDAEFRPYLTFKVIAAAQGFPSAWGFHAAKHGIIEMIAEALPPVLAKAVGLSLRTALTGETFDLETTVRTPVIVKSHIGQRRMPGRLMAARRYRPQEPGVAQENPMRVHEAAMRVLNGEDLKVVEPNHKKRGPIKREVLSIEWEQALQDAEEEAWEAHLFPDGLPT